MLPTKVIERYGEPTHPSVRPMRLGKGQGLAHLTLIAQATRTMKHATATPLLDVGADLTFVEA
jgi:hypothetical protein